MNALLLFVVLVTALAVGMLIAAIAQRVHRAVPIFAVAVAVAVGVALIIAIASRVTS